MTSNAKHLEKQLAELRENLLLIETRKSQFVQQTDVPLQLIKDEKDTREAIAQLERQLKDLSERVTTPPPKRKLREKMITRVVLGSAVSIVVAVFGVLRLFPPGGTPSQSQPTVAVVVATLTPEAVMALPVATLPPTPVPTQTPAASPTVAASVVSETAMVTPNVPAAPSLPDYAPALTTTVVLIAEPACQAELTSLQGFVADQAKGMTPLVEVQLNQSAIATKTEEARAVGLQQVADLVIWCAKAGDETTVYFELMTQRTPAEVYDPPTISVSAAPADRLQRLGVGLVHYLRRHYEAATPVLKTAADMTDVGDATARTLMKLLVGNGILFRRQYAEAAKQYEAIVDAEPTLAFAWNNLGVARLNASWNEGEVNRFDSAIKALMNAQKADERLGLPLISLARVYRFISDDLPEAAEKAKQNCEAMKTASTERVQRQSEMCLVRLQTHLANTGISDQLPQMNAAVLQRAATASEADSLAALGFANYLYWTRNSDAVAKTDARRFFIAYLLAASDDVLLAETLNIYNEISSEF